MSLNQPRTIRGQAPSIVLYLDVQLIKSLLGFDQLIYFKKAASLILSKCPEKSGSIHGYVLFFIFINDLTASVLFSLAAFPIQIIWSNDALLRLYLLL